MKSKTSLLLLASALLAPSVTLHAENASPARAISQERMQQVYEEVKTPFKYGVVIRGEANQLVDSPSVFRKDGQWYMVYHFYNAVGDQGRVIKLATSKDLKNPAK